MKYKVYKYLCFILLVYLGFKEINEYNYEQLKNFVNNFLVELNIKEKTNSSNTLESENLVYFFNFEKSELLKYEDININNDVKDYIELKEQIILKPNLNYKIYRNFYNFQKEGLYRIYDFKENTSMQIIVYNNDLYSLLSSLSWLIIHGNKHDNIEFNKRLNLLQNSILSMTCGDTSMFIEELLNKLGIEVRRVNFLTLDKWNTYNNGHVALEVKIQGSWKMFDIDNNSYPVLNGHHLNAFDLIELDSLNNVEFIKLSNDVKMDSLNFTEKNINYAFFGEYTFNNIKEWYERIFQVLYFKTRDDFLYLDKFSSEDNKRIQQYFVNIKPISEKEFKIKFYGE